MRTRLFRCDACARALERTVANWLTRTMPASQSLRPLGASHQRVQAFCSGCRTANSRESTGDTAASSFALPSATSCLGLASAGEQMEQEGA